MVEIFVVVIVGLLMVGLSMRVNARFRQVDRLPMQWSFTGMVNWTAPRVLALSLAPALAICILTVSAIMMLLFEPRSGQEGLEAPILVLMGFVFVAVHLLHLWMIDRHLQRNGS